MTDSQVGDDFHDNVQGPIQVHHYGFGLARFHYNKLQAG
jgi:hypothetical protein